MAKKKKQPKSDRDVITEAVLEAANKRLDTMSGDELKAEADRMAKMPTHPYSDYSPWWSKDNPYERGTIAHDAFIRGDELPIGMSASYRGHDKYPGPEKPIRAQEYGPWEKGRPREGGYSEGTGPVWPTDTGPWPFYGRTLPGMGYMRSHPNDSGVGMSEGYPHPAYPGSHGYPYEDERRGNSPYSDYPPPGIARPRPEWHHNVDRFEYPGQPQDYLGQQEKIFHKKAIEDMEAARSSGPAQGILKGEAKKPKSKKKQSKKKGK